MGGSRSIAGSTEGTHLPVANGASGQPRHSVGQTRTERAKTWRLKQRTGWRARAGSASRRAQDVPMRYFTTSSGARTVAALLDHATAREAEFAPATVRD